MIASMVHSGPLSRSMKLMEDKAKNIAIPMERSAIRIRGTECMQVTRKLSKEAKEKPNP